MSGSLIEAHEAEQIGFETSKSTIRFTPDKSLPDVLIRKLIKARLMEQTG